MLLLNLIPLIDVTFSTPTGDYTQKPAFWEGVKMADELTEKNLPEEGDRDQKTTRFGTAEHGGMNWNGNSISSTASVNNDLSQRFFQHL
jgi:hypothetical protein